MEEAGVTVRAAIIRAMPGLTAADRKLAQAVLADYPFNGLQTVTELSALTGVSPPSITRFVAKLGFAGYSEFQRRLIGELKEGARSPLDLMAGASRLPRDRFLDDYAARVGQVAREMAESVPPETLERVCALLADRSRQVFTLGGRISDAIAQYLAVHLQQVRDRVVHLPQVPEQWPDHLMRMRRQDVVILFDFRRYQPDIARLARLVREERRASVVLVTDKWLSPVARQASHVFGLPIGIGTAWDTGITAMALAEAMIVRVSEADWPAARARIAALEALRPGHDGQEAGDPAPALLSPSAAPLPPERGIPDDT